MLKKQNIVFFMLCIAWLASFFVSMISNYKPSTFLIKGIVSVIILGLIYFDSVSVKNRSVIIESKELIKKLLVILLIVVTIPAVTLLYSSNPLYGSIKLASIIISTVPCVLGLYYIVLTFDAGRLKVFLTSVILMTAPLTLAALVLKPFSFIAPFSFSLTNWSHVLFARFISSALVLLLILHFKLTGVKHLYVSGLIIFILLSGILLSGHKASILGVLMAVIFMVGYYGIKTSWRSQTVYTTMIALVLSFTFIFLIQGNEESLRRASTIVNPEELTSEGGVAARLMLWERTILSGTDNIPFGTGLGGLNTEEALGKDLQEHEYPHNLILEIFGELGIVPLLVFLILLIQIIKTSIRTIPEFTVVFLYFLWLSFFSKDIATNTQLWFGLIILAISNGTTEKVKDSFKEAGWLAGPNKKAAI